MERILGRLNQIISGMFDGQLAFEPKNRLLPGLWPKDDLECRSENQLPMPRFLSGPEPGSFGFPVLLNGRFAGLAIVSGLNDTSETRLQQISDLVTLVLENALTQLEQVDLLEEIETRISLLREDTNVIPLRPQRPIGVQKPSAPTTIAPAHPAFGNVPLLIHCETGFPLERLALEIHSLSHRWAFVRIEDLPSDIFDSRQSFQQLGSITIYIRDICRLTPEQQEHLASFLRSAPPNGPHVIAGTALHPSDLERDFHVTPELMECFSISHLRWGAGQTLTRDQDLVTSGLVNLLEQMGEPALRSDRPVNLIPFNIKYLHPDPDTLH